MRADIVAEILIVLGILLIAAAAMIWVGVALAVLVLGLGALAAGIVVAYGGIGR